MLVDEYRGSISDSEHENDVNVVEDSDICDRDKGVFKSYMDFLGIY